MYAISFFGLGRVGLTMAACFASRDFRVIGFDVNEEKVKIINRGKAPFFEPELDVLVKDSVEKGLLRATTNPSEAILNADLTFITVGTPSAPDGSIDLRYVKSALALIGESLRHKENWHLVVLKSTVVPTTTERVVKPIIEEVSSKRCGYSFGLCVNPEFLREGSAVRDVFKPDRIIIGEFDKRSGDTLEDFYGKFYGEETPPTIRTTPVNAELIKYASNAFLAMKVSFINMIANLCQKLPGADVNVVAEAIGLDKRIGSLFLKAGAGGGGPCFGKDLAALKKFAESLGASTSLIDATIQVNEQQPLNLIKLAEKHLGNLKGKRIAILGLSFKPNTDDITDAPSIKLVRGLLDEGAEITVYDPKTMENFRGLFGNSIKYAFDATSCIKGADCAIIVTEWKEFKNIPPEIFLELMRTPLLIEGRRIYPPKEYSKHLKFEAIGYSP
ncbi:UDP-glucose/GDP-mannose dehydrogenase family protein [Candidatus Bathyarchaeota archaeon]|nr:UDP-glucose/GDP-mannose dehydrogenase family protein [Candidatus Bathyarchaeota archaeon]